MERLFFFFYSHNSADESDRMAAIQRQEAPGR